MIFTFIAERCSDLPVTPSCRAMKVTTSGFYEWHERQASPARRTLEDRALSAMIIEIHRQSRASTVPRGCMPSSVSAPGSTSGVSVSSG